MLTETQLNSFKELQQVLNSHDAHFIVQACNSFEELLAAAQKASQALHQLHPKTERIEVGRGMCTWLPCKLLYEAITKATSPQTE